MTPAALRRLALSLPQAHEEPHFERASFRVGKKIFATMTPDGSEAMVRVEADGVQALLSARPDVFFSYGGWTVRNGSLGVHLAKIDARTMHELLVDSYRRVAPKKLAASLGGPPAPRGKASRPRHDR